MYFDEISPVMRMFIGNREGFRKLGFSADDLFCLVSPSARTRSLACFLLLKTQGKEFYVECGPVVVEQQAWQRHYEDVCEAINGGRVSQEDLDRIWQESAVYQNAVSLIETLQNKGIHMPSVERAVNARSQN